MDGCDVPCPEEFCVEGLETCGIDAAAAFAVSSLGSVGIAERELIFMTSSMGTQPVVGDVGSVGGSFDVLELGVVGTAPGFATSGDGLQSMGGAMGGAVVPEATTSGEGSQLMVAGAAGGSTTPGEGSQLMAVVAGPEGGSMSTGLTNGGAAGAGGGGGGSGYTTPGGVSQLVVVMVGPEDGSPSTGLADGAAAGTAGGSSTPGEGSQSMGGVSGEGSQVVVEGTAGGSTTSGEGSQFINGAVVAVTSGGGTSTPEEGSQLIEGAVVAGMGGSTASGDRSQFIKGALVVVAGAGGTSTPGEGSQLIEGEVVADMGGSTTSGDGSQFIGGGMSAFELLLSLRVWLVVGEDGKDVADPSVEDTAENVGVAALLLFMFESESTFVGTGGIPSNVPTGANTLVRLGFKHVSGIHKLRCR